MLVRLPALRRRSGLCMRTVACTFLAIVLWLQLQMSSHYLPQPVPSTVTVEEVSRSTSLVINPGESWGKVVTVRPGNGSGQLSIDDIRHNIQVYNELQTVINEDVFGPVQNDTLVIVVQVHKRLSYLRHLITSLAQARGIDSVLLVFSHDYYDEEINELVQKVDFCKVMQIFYPHSIQTHPHEFPGESPGDCPRNIKKEKAKEMGCTNALHPDSYGHYREAKFTQIKHHWWWKANRVFNQLRVTRKHEGLVLFLEEDHYISEDFIQILRLMQHTSHSSCQGCNILSLGTYQKNYDYGRGSNKATVMEWTGNKHNMGMALNRTIWKTVMACAHVFCAYDDYNWDWSLQFAAQECLSKDLVAMMMNQPRVFHLGECGLHHNKRDCEPTAAMSSVQNLLKSARQHLYPTELSANVASLRRKKLVKSNGGWGDVRDHELCLNMTMVTS